MRQGQNTVYQEILHLEKVSFLVIRTRTGVKNSLKATSSKTPARTTLRKTEKLKEGRQANGDSCQNEVENPQHQTQQEAETRAKAIFPTSLPKRVFGNAPFSGAEDRLYCCIS
ncbi:hypothetical protein LGW72_09175 [Streptococcus mutans]|nr:hypothetical protein [Streptococcus mutans]MCB4960798.1 hypothetical protein [Streptococcus mutans]